MNMPPPPWLLLTSVRAKLYKFPNNSKNILDPRLRRQQKRPHLPSILNVFHIFTKMFVNMSALSVLYLVLPFFVIFILHEVEEVAAASRWMSRRGKEQAERFPRLGNILGRLSGVGTLGFSVVAAEEVLVLLVVTLYLLGGGGFAGQIWLATFLAYSVHVMARIAEAVVTKGYVPGLVTALFSLPFVWYGVHSASLVFKWWQMATLALAGVLFAAANLCLTLKLASKLSKQN